MTVTFHDLARIAHPSYAEALRNVEGDTKIMYASCEKVCERKLAEGYVALTPLTVDYIRSVAGDDASGYNEMRVTITLAPA